MTPFLWATIGFACGVAFTLMLAAVTSEWGDDDD